MTETATRQSPGPIRVIRRGPEFVVIQPRTDREWVGFGTRDEAEAHADWIARN